jgi:hypothetical protein
MPCYDPPMTHGEVRDYHESQAKRILKGLGIGFSSGPDAVQRLCDWCNKHTMRQIDEAGAKYWREDHRRFDLRQSGLAKLTDAEKAALGLRDGDKA